MTTPTTERIPTSARNADILDLAALLKTQNAAKLDLVVPACNIAAVNCGQLGLTGVPVQMNERGVTDPNGAYAVTEVGDDGLSDKLRIPRAYLRDMRSRHGALLDANINGWLTHEAYAERSYLVRTFQGDTEDGTRGIVRAFLSDSYRVVDNWDVLGTALETVRDVAPDAQVYSCDLSERRMIVNFAVPSFTAEAPTFLSNYTSPFGEGGVQRAGRIRDFGFGADAGGRPIVFSGLRLTNSETGGGKFKLQPVIIVQVCTNGQTIPGLSVEAVHLGGKLEAGVVQWSDETQARNLDLIKAKTKDAVRTFLAPTFLAEQVAKIEAKSGTEISDAPKAVQVVSRELKYSDHEMAGILDHFSGAQPVGRRTSGGLVNAITSYAQTVQSPDRATELTDTALRALDLVRA